MRHWECERSPHVSVAGILPIDHSPDLRHTAFYTFVASNEPLVELASDYVLTFSFLI